MNLYTKQLTSFLIKKTFAIIFLMSFFTAAAYSENHADSDKQPAPNFTLKSQTGKNIKLSELRGQVIALNFWSTWCGNCIQLFPFIELYNKQNSAKDFTLLSINIDEDPSVATRFINKRNFNYAVLFDTKSTVSRLYEATDLPAFILIDRDGNIRYTLDDDQIKQFEITQQLIEGLLNE